MGSLLKIFCCITSALLLTNNLFARETNINAQEHTIPLMTEGFYPEYPPVTIKSPEQRELVLRGEYLAKIGDCISCHTNVAGGTPAYAGRLPIETPFGTFYSPNITPDKKTGIGNWTEEDFIRAVKKGRDPHGRNYFPVFPYIYFATMTDEDVKALYAYFMSIPPVELENKPLPFPFNVPGARLSLWGWNLLFFFPRDTTIEYDKTKSAEWNRGRYLVDSLGHCGMCHTPLNIFGAPKDKYYLTGGFIDGYWAPNITKHGLMPATLEDVTNVFSQNQLINNAGPVVGPMAEVNNNSLKYLTKEDQLAIATYLKTVDNSIDPYYVKPSNEPPSLRRGREVFLKSCVICHKKGEMGAPIIGNGPSWFARLKTSSHKGLYDHAINGFNSMPYRGACVSCSDNDIKSAVDYILNQSLSRSQWRDMKKEDTKPQPVDGKTVYEQYCSACHTEGKLGAPKIGDTKVWNALIEKNLDVLVINTINSEAHPRNGGCPDCTTAEIIEAVKYMLSQSHVEGNYSLW